jgi:NADH:ubiquinone oxidoreductase subunit H
MLIVLSLLLGRRQNSLQLTAWIAAQNGWNGLQWMAWTQPLPALLWLICAKPRAKAGACSSWAGSSLALNRALLTSTLICGGWQGPFVTQWPGLGLLYTTIKVIAIGSIWVWIEVTRPRPTLTAHSHTVRQVWVPLAILNLAVTALFVLAL